jgi:spermidine synthase
MLARDKRSVTIVDVNPASFRIARQYFDLPDVVSCEVADGKTFLTSDMRAYDAIVLDAFQGNRMPTHLQSRLFFCLIRDHLTPRGSMFANVYLKDNLDDGADRLADSMRGVWSNVRLLDSEDSSGRNAIAMAGSVSNLRPPRLVVQPMAYASEIDAELAMMRYRAPRVRP